MLSGKNMRMHKALPAKALILASVIRRFSFILNLETASMLLIVIGNVIAARPNFRLRLPLESIARMLLEL